MANNFLIELFGYADADELIGKELEILIPSAVSSSARWRQK